MDKVVMKANIKKIYWELLEEKYSIRRSEVSETNGTIEDKRGLISLPVKKKKFNKNGAIHNIRVAPTGTYLHCEFNPNRLFSEYGNVFQITTNDQLNSAMKWLDTTLKEVFGISLKSSGREYHKIHYNYDIKLRKFPDDTYSKVWELMADCVTGGADIYAKKTEKYRRLINGTGFEIAEDIKQCNYDKGIEQGDKDLKVHRFETRWETMSSIKVSFQSANVDKISIGKIKKKIGELFEENVFSGVKATLRDYEDIIYKSLILQKENNRYYLGAWIGEIKEYIFDIQLLRMALQMAGIQGSTLDSNMKRAKDILVSYEENDIEKYKTSYTNNFDRLNEIYKGICGGNKNLI